MYVKLGTNEEFELRGITISFYRYGYTMLPIGYKRPKISICKMQYDTFMIFLALAKVVKQKKKKKR